MRIIPDTQSHVITKVHDLLGQPSYFRATNIYNDNETCYAALGFQALQRVNNLCSLGGLDLLCQVKFGFRIETFVIRSVDPL